MLTDTLVFRDTTYAAGLRVNSTFGTSQAFLTYRYAFMAKERTQIGAALGIGLIFLRADIAATAGATAGGPDTAIAEFSRKGDINGPTGSLGGYGRFQLGDRWYLESDLRALVLKIDNIKVGVVEARRSRDATSSLTKWDSSWGTISATTRCESTERTTLPASTAPARSATRSTAGV